MTVGAVKLNEIDKRQTVEVTVSRKCDCDCHSLVIGFGADCFGYPLTVKDIDDLSDGNHILPGFFDQIECSRGKGCDGVIVTVCSALEIRILPDKRSCDNAPDRVFALHDLACLLTDFIELRYRNQVFMCGNLQNAVC